MSILILRNVISTPLILLVGYSTVPCFHSMVYFSRKKRWVTFRFARSDVCSASLQMPRTVCTVPDYCNEKLAPVYACSVNGVSSEHVCAAIAMRRILHGHYLENGLQTRSPENNPTTKKPTLILSTTPWSFPPIPFPRTDSEVGKRKVEFGLRRLSCAYG